MHNFTRFCFKSPLAHAKQSEVRRGKCIIKREWRVKSEGGKYMSMSEEWRAFNKSGE